MLCERCRREVENGEPELLCDVAQLVIAELPWIPVREYLHLPSSGGVYFALVDEKICYIGTSASLAGRWRHHPHLPRLIAHNGRIAWLVISDKAERERVELEAIALFSPLWNCGGAEYLDWSEALRRWPKSVVTQRVGVSLSSAQ